MQQAGGPGGPRPPQILADQKAPPGSGGAPHYYRPPRIFDPCCIPASYATVIVTYFEITANSEIHTNKPEKPAVCTSDKIKADLAEAKLLLLRLR